MAVREYQAPDSITSCPACGGIESVQVGGVATAFDAAAGPTTLHQPAYAIRYCARCDLYFKSHPASPEALDHYYERLECDTYEIGDTFPTERYFAGG